MRSTEVLLDSSIRPDGVLPPPFACWWTRHSDDAVCVRLSGELDVATSPRLERTLEGAQQRARMVVVDLRQVAFADSSALHALVQANTRARRQGSRLVVLRGPPHVDRIFTLSRVGDALEIVDSEATEATETALRRLAARGGVAALRSLTPQVASATERAGP